MYINHDRMCTCCKTINIHMCIYEHDLAYVCSHQVQHITIIIKECQELGAFLHFGRQAMSSLWVASYLFFIAFTYFAVLNVAPWSQVLEAFGVCCCWCLIPPPSDNDFWIVQTLWALPDNKQYVSLKPPCFTAPQQQQCRRAS